jgi:citrate lyase alpha subunit
VIQDPSFWASVDSVNEARNKADGLLDARQYEAAYASINAFNKERPDLADGVLDVRGECSLLTGRYTAAYNLLVQRVKFLQTGKKNSISPQYMLDISLASSALGEVYPGQADYCRNQVIKGLSQQGIRDKLDPQLAKRTDAKGVAIMSCLGLGIARGRTPYLELALSLTQPT